MFIEPRLVLNKERGRRVYPDIVICNTKHVICVVEIKYLPRALPHHDKDVRKLRRIARVRSRKRIFVSNVRYRGPTADAKKYWFSDDVVYVWAGVHKAPEVSYESRPMFSDRIKELAGCLLQLHAETDPVTEPNVFARGLAASDR